MSRVEVIGAATLYLGDAREIVPYLAGGLDAIVTDPPYGMAFRSNHRLERHTAIINDCNDTLLGWACGLKPHHSAYVFCRWDNIASLPKPRSCITWVKNNWSMGDLEHEHARQTEIALFYPGAGHDWPSSRPADVIRAPRTGNENHPTEKPVQLMAAFVRWTRGVVVDPFMGSGSTGIACAIEGRSFVGVEIDLVHFYTACRRIEQARRQGELFAGTAA